MDEKLTILLVGSGGREHALAWKLARSPLVHHIYTAPGNAGTASEPRVTNIPCDIEDFSALVRLAQDKNVNFLVPAPDAPIVAGIVDYFEQHAPHISSFGPSKTAARMEGSKTFSKDFMKRHGVPTAAYENFDDYETAKRYLDSISHDIVIKADGLAAGKGVIIPQNRIEAHQALRDVMQTKTFGNAGDKVVIEEFMTGHELSILTFCDGHTFKSLPPAQDHKRIGEGDTGPNTGGMGAYAPTPLVTQADLDEIDRTILKPTLDGMRKEGMPFVGCLFTGLMMTPSGIRVVEYNVRFGDPETQSVLPLMTSDLAEIMLACTKGDLATCELKLSADSAATVVMAAKGYPSSYARGLPMTINAAKKPDGVIFYHAGTTFDGDGYKTAGGRVIASTATASTLQHAVKLAYEGVGCIEFDGMQYRRDIAARALQ